MREFIKNKKLVRAKEMSGFGGFSFASFTSKLQEAGEKVCDPYLMQRNASVSICLRNFLSIGFLPIVCLSAFAQA